MRNLKSLIEALWKPEEVMGRSTTWLLPYLTSVLLVGLLGFYTRFRIGGQLASQLQELGVSAEGITLFQRGSYIGIAVVALAMPILIPWIAAFLSKFIALFSGSRVTFAEFFSLYQWGYYLSTFVTVILKGILFMALPVDAWGRVTLSLAALIPESPRLLAAAASALDLSLILLFAAACVGLKGRKRNKELTIPVWALLTFVVVQVSLTT